MRKFIAVALGCMAIAGGGAATAMAEPSWGVPNTVSDAVPADQQGAGMLSVPGPSGTDATVAAACRLHTWPVAQIGNELHVRGGRFDCANWSNWRVELHRNRQNWSDVKLATVYSGGNGSAVAIAGCDGRAEYYGRTISDTGNQVTGARGVFC